MILEPSFVSSPNSPCQGLMSKTFNFSDTKSKDTVVSSGTLMRGVGFVALTYCLLVRIAMADVHLSRCLGGGHPAAGVSRSDIFALPISLKASLSKREIITQVLFYVF